MNEEILDSIDTNCIIISGTTRIPVIIPENATAVENSAAKELVDYVKKITGKVLSISVEPSEASGTIIKEAIYIGNTRFANANNIIPTSDENWIIKSIDNNLVLTGGAQRGVLYSVYHLLEDEFGVRWWNRYEEYVPISNDLRITNSINKTGTPAMEYRDIYDAIVLDRIQYGWDHMFDESITKSDLIHVRNRMNGNGAYTPVEYGSMEIFGAPFSVHTLGIYFSDTDYKDHPEWFALVNGKRINTGQFCITNENFQAETAKRVKSNIVFSNQVALAAHSPLPKYYSVGFNDTEDFCQCENCASIIEKSGMSGYILQYINKIANNVGATYPDVKIETLAYWAYLEPPKDSTVPADNVVLRLADNESDILHSLSHINNVNALRRLKSWSKITNKGNFFIWDYAINYSINPPFPTMFKLQENYKTYADNGVNGFFVEHQRSIITDFWAMKQWMMTKLMENPYTTTDLIHEFVYGYYGSSAPYIYDYLKLINNAVQQSVLSVHFGTEISIKNYMTLDVVLQSVKLFDEAEKSADDSAILRRVRLARSCLDKVIVTKFDDYISAAKIKGEFDPHHFIIDKVISARRIIDILNEEINFRKLPSTSYAYEDVQSENNFFSKYVNQELVNFDKSPTNILRPEELRNIEEFAILDIPIEKMMQDDGYNMYGFTVVNDSDSPYGKVLKMTLNSIENAQIKEYHTVDNNDKDLRVFSIGYANIQITPYRRDLISDGKYHLYKISNIRDVKPKPNDTHRTTFYTFRSWIISVDLVSVYDIMPSTSYDVYISIKTTGSMYNGSATDTDCVYIDRAYVVDATIPKLENIVQIKNLTFDGRVPVKML